MLINSKAKVTPPEKDSALVQSVEKLCARIEEYLAGISQ